MTSLKFPPPFLAPVMLDTWGYIRGHFSFVVNLGGRRGAIHEALQYFFRDCTNASESLSEDDSYSLGATSQGTRGTIECRVTGAKYYYSTTEFRQFLRLPGAHP